jgi:putative NIF3 family GTP cyclohydrolase 1 type 2
MLEAHPYEEPAYDVYPLEPVEAHAGLGVVGRLKKKATLGALRSRALRRLRPLLPEAARAAFRRIQLVGDPSLAVRRVAICSGSAGSLVGPAVAAGVEALITGEISHHDAIEARAQGLAVVALGHFVSEASGMPRFAAALDGALTPAGSARPVVRFLVAQSETDPILNA